MSSWAIVTLASIDDANDRTSQTGAVATKMIANFLLSIGLAG